MPNPPADRTVRIAAASILGGLGMIVASGNVLLLPVALVGGSFVVMAIAKLASDIGRSVMCLGVRLIGPYAMNEGATGSL